MKINISLKLCRIFLSSIELAGLTHKNRMGTKHFTFYAVIYNNANVSKRRPSVSNIFQLLFYARVRSGFHPTEFYICSTYIIVYIDLVLVCGVDHAQNHMPTEENIAIVRDGKASSEYHRLKYQSSNSIFGAVTFVI